MIHHHYAKEWRRSFCCGHPSQDVWIRHHYPHYSILWPSSILAQRLRARLYHSKIGTSSVLSYKNTILTGDNSRHPRSQQIGMGSKTCKSISRTNRKNGHRERFFRCHLGRRHWNGDGVSCCVTRRVFFFSYFRFSQQKGCAMRSARARTPTLAWKWMTIACWAYTQGFASA